MNDCSGNFQDSGRFFFQAFGPENPEENSYNLELIELASKRK
jgi:hypothetical protein